MQSKPIACLTFLALFLSGCGQSDPGTDVPAAGVAEVKDLGVVSQDSKLVGRDGGYSGQWNGRLVWVFGDTLIRQATSSGQNWFSNTWSASDDFDAGDGLTRLDLGVAETGEITELLPYTSEEQQFNDVHFDRPGCMSPCGARYALWPGPVVADPVRNRSLVFYQKVYAEPGEFNFRNVGYSLAVWQNNELNPVRPIVSSNSDDPTLLFTSPEYQPGIGAIVEDDNLYSFICHSQWIDLFCSLARVPLQDALSRDAWEFLDGSGRWTSNPRQANDLFKGAPMMSVAYSEYLSHYVVVYSEPLGGPIVLRTAPRLTGPWSEQVVIGYPLPSDNGNGWVYDGLMHPDLTTENGQVLFLTYTRGVAGTREVRLLKVRLVRG